ncbi:hypothetical protein TI04_09315 [Achromatium sp. WMS2]|nr:hypothetical protein TI04_09315 [Achromatium sp. WMS2]
MTKSIIMNGEAKTIFNEFLWESGLDNSVRLATMQDVESIVHIEQKCFDVTKYDSLLDAPSVQKLLGKSNGVLIVYEQEHPTRPKIAGYAQVYFRKKSPTARFFSLAVLPEWQGQGIANLLFKSVEIRCSWWWIMGWLKIFW